MTATRDRATDTRAAARDKPAGQADVYRRKGTEVDLGGLRLKAETGRERWLNAYLTLIAYIFMHVKDFDDQRAG